MANNKNLKSITDILGSDEFPNEENRFYEIVETIASQNIRAVKNSNAIEDGFYNYDITTGKVVEEIIIEMAKSQATDKVVPDFSPKDAKMAVKYFNNFNERTFKTTTREDEVESIIASKSVVDADAVISQIVSTLTEGEGFEDYTYMRDIITNESVGVDVTDTLFSGKTPSSMKGVAFAMREMYNSVKATNKLGNVPFNQATPVDDIRIAVSEKVLNLLDVVELAHLFNLEKEKLFGKLVVLPYDADNTAPNKILVYDRKALGRATKYLKYKQDVLGSTMYNNHFLHVSRAYFFNSLFKAISIDVSNAVNKTFDTLFETVNNGQDTSNTTNNNR